MYEDTTGSADEEIKTIVEQKGFARNQIIDLRIKIAMINVDSVQKFNITDEGRYLGICSDQGRLKILQRHDAKFSFRTNVPSSPTPVIKRVEQKAQGFTINPITGLKQGANTNLRMDSPAVEIGPPLSAPTDPLKEIEQLANLRDRGILTEEEFRIKKKMLLGL